MSDGDRDTIFETKHYFIKKTEINKEGYIDNEEYIFPFKFQLPGSTLPTSFEFYYGDYSFYIGYLVNVTLDVPWSLNKYAKKCFTVINPLDLNRLPALRQPYGVSDTKIICCGPCKRDPITIELNTNKTGYVAGETIIFNATIDNRSSETIISLSAALEQHIFTRNSSKVEFGYDIVALKYPGEKIDPYKLVNWSDVKLKIPTVCPSTIETCKIIKIEYKLTVVIVFIGFNKKRVELPITIGTVPLNDSPSSISFPANPIFSSDYYNGIDNKTNDTLFKPKYPFYT